jgi:hypothetical protein
VVGSAPQLVSQHGPNLLPEDERYWELTHRRPRVSFDAAARATLEAERRNPPTTGRLGRIEEEFLRRISPRSRAPG